MTTPGTLQETKEISTQQLEGDAETPWEVILFNDGVHSCDEVVFQIQKATGAGLPLATQVMMKVHLEGLAICYCGPRKKCERVATILREISLIVEVLRGN